MKISIDTRDLKNLEADLKAFASRAYPHATKQTINKQAFVTQSVARDRIKKTLTLRNPYTLTSVRVTPTRSLSVARQVSETGSIADYMADQERGLLKTKQGAEGVPLPTNYAAGLARDVQPRTRLPRRVNQLQQIRLKHNLKGIKGRNQRNAAAIRHAAGSTNKFVYLDLKQRKGIFKVVGSRSRPRVQMVYDLSREAVTIPAQPWLLPATEIAGRQAANIYLKALEFQARRAGIFHHRRRFY